MDAPLKRKRNNSPIFLTRKKQKDLQCGFKKEMDKAESQHRLALFYSKEEINRLCMITYGKITRSILKEINAPQSAYSLMLAVFDVTRSLTYDATKELLFRIYPEHFRSYCVDTPPSLPSFISAACFDGVFFRCLSLPFKADHDLECFERGKEMTAANKKLFRYVLYLLDWIPSKL